MVTKERFQASRALFASFADSAQTITFSNAVQKYASFAGDTINMSGRSEL